MSIGEDKKSLKKRPNTESIEQLKLAEKQLQKGTRTKAEKKSKKF